MGERVSSDHPSIDTFRASIERSGATRRPRLVLPPEAEAVVPTEVVRLVFDGATYFVDVRAGQDGPVVNGAYDNPRLARSPGDGANRLPGWLEAIGLTAGRSVLFDVVVPETLYGVRAPGTTTVYETVELPPSSLSDIAASLDE